MECNKVHKLLEGYIDKKLSSNLIDEVKKHLDSCYECKKLYHSVSISLDFLKPTSEITEQPYYFTRLKQKMENKYEVKTSLISQLFSKKILQPVTYLASIIIAVYIGILIGSNSPNINQTSDFKSDTTTLETFAEYSYFNDLQLETIESLIIEEE